MTDWSLVFLGVIALATLTMAAIQVGVIVYAGRLKWRMDRLAETVEQDLKPLMGRLKEMSGDAARVTSLAVAQAERVDQLFAEFSQRSDHILSLVQNAVVVPAREGMAVLEACGPVLRRCAALPSAERLSRRGRPRTKRRSLSGRERPFRGRRGYSAGASAWPPHLAGATWLKGAWSVDGQRE